MTEGLKEKIMPAGVSSGLGEATARRPTGQEL
jgi:hypothetical protein